MTLSENRFPIIAQKYEIKCHFCAMQAELRIMNALIIEEVLYE